MSRIDKRGQSLPSLSLYIKRTNIITKDMIIMKMKMCEKCNQVEIEVVTSNKYCDECRILARKETFKVYSDNGGIGIYKIVNLANNKIYIGQSVDVRKRILGHKSTLENNNHYNMYLQRSYNKYGLDNFIFELIEYCNENELYSRENYWIKYYNSCDSNFGYNATLPSENEKKYRLSDESKKKLSDNKRVFSDEELLSYLQEYYYHFGKVPTTRDIIQTKGFPSNHIFFKRFGSFKNALIQAGLYEVAENKSVFDRYEYTKEDVYEKFKKFVNTHSRFPNHIELKKTRENDLPSTSVILKHYGSTENLKKEFGFDRESVVKLENEELLKDLVKLYNQDGQISSRTIDKSLLTRSAKLYAERFGTLANAYKLAEIPYVKHSIKY